MSDKTMRYHGTRQVEFLTPCPFCRLQIKSNTRNGCAGQLKDHIIMEHLDKAFESIIAGGGEDASHAKRMVVNHFILNRGKWQSTRQAKRDDTPDF